MAMVGLESLSTDGVAPGKRLDFWNNAACEALTEQCAEARSPLTFSGRMTRGEFGELRFVEFTSDAAIIRRSWNHIARSREAFFLLRMQLAGKSVSSQNGRDALLVPGDFTLCDGLRPYKIAFGDTASMLTLRISRTTLLRYFGSPESLVLLPMSGTTGPGVLASSLLREVWQAADSVLLPAAVPRIVNALLELIASAYDGLPAAKPDKSVLASSLRVRILEHIERNVRDPDLTPTEIARAFRITPRYLHRLFSQQGKTVSRYVLHRRLGGCRAALVDPRLAGRSLTRIAGDHGFKSLPHFSRVFRDEFGMSPSNYRDHARES
jgi:AraC-like DNA-binding protein